eukprot:1594852-Amphidinium_carterae.1
MVLSRNVHSRGACIGAHIVKAPLLYCYMLLLYITAHLFHVAHDGWRCVHGAYFQIHPHILKNWPTLD